MPDTKLLDPDLRRVRALGMVKRRIMQAMSIPAIAQEFHVSEKTVTKEINYAKRMGLVADFEDQILEDLVPDAIKAFKTALKNGDAQVALEVLKGTGLLRKPTDKPLTAPAPLEESLEIHIKRIHAHRPDQPAVSSTASSGADLGGVLEGALLSAEETAPRLGPGRDEGGHALDEPDLGVSADPA